MRRTKKIKRHLQAGQRALEQLYGIQKWFPCESKGKSSDYPAMQGWHGSSQDQGKHSCVKHRWLAERYVWESKISPFLTQRAKGNPVDRPDFQLRSFHVSLPHGHTGSDLLPRHCATATGLPTLSVLCISLWHGASPSALTTPVRSIIYPLTLWPLTDWHSPSHSVPYVYSFLGEIPTLVLLPLWWATLSSAPQVSYSSIISSTFTFPVHLPCQFLVKQEWSPCLPCPVTSSCELDGIWINVFHRSFW